VCRDCGLSLGSDAQRRTLVTGWWGIWSVLANPIYLMLNRLALGKIRALPEPAYANFPRPGLRIIGATPAAAAHEETGALAPALG
jgi:hypothetical protein